MRTATTTSRKLCSLLIAPFLCTWLAPSCTRENENLNVIFVGDLMLDRGVRKTIEKKGAESLFENVKELLTSADISVVNFECVACDTTLNSADKKFTFRANPEWLSSLYNAGITHANLANNHISDYGVAGVHQTASNLQRHGIIPIGYHVDNNLSCRPGIVKKKGNSIAIFSSCLFRQTSNHVCYDDAWKLSKRIKEFKNNHPEQLILVSLHWGVEMTPEPTYEQTEQAHLLINAGADVIIGHHPHVTQTIEKYNGKYIFYSLGNFIFDNSNASTSSGISALLSVSKNKILSSEIVPIKITGSIPALMTDEESEIFVQKLDSISQTVELKQSNAAWKII